MFRSLNLPGGITRIGTFGQPYHGIATQTGAADAELVLPNSAIFDLGRRFNGGHTRLTKRPGWDAVARTGDAATRDTANGWQWPNYWLFGGFFTLMMEVDSRNTQAWVFLDTDGSAWSCALQRSPLRLYFQRFGLFSEIPAVQDYISPTAPTTTPSSSMVFENHSADGTHACWRDVGTRKLYEITITGSGGSGPYSASFSEIDLVLSSDYTEDVDMDTVYTLWFASCNKEATGEVITKSAYVGTTNTLSHDKIHVTATVSATQDIITTGDPINHYEAATSITWTYAAKFKKDDALTWTDLPTLTAARQMNQFVDWDDPEYEVDVSDSMSMGATTYTGTYHERAWLDDPGGGFDNFLRSMLQPTPTLAASIGIGEFENVVRWYFDDVKNDWAAEQVTLDSTYPYFTQVVGFMSQEIKLLLDLGDEASPPSTSTMPELHGVGFTTSSYSAHPFELSSWWGGLGCALDKPTNNSIVVRVYEQAPTETSTMTKTWGPVIATEASDATELTGNNHYVSYHPVTKAIERSTTSQLCWI